MHILGISAYYHDSAAVILQDDKIIAAAQEERFTRRKHDSGFPENAVKYCLREAGLALDELDGIVFYDKPFLKFERLLETYYAFAPQGLRSFLSAMPVWIKEKLLLRKLITDELAKIAGDGGGVGKIFFSEHHLSHAASAFYPSPFAESAILTIDGVGEWATASISHGEGNRIKMLRELKFPHSLGLLYSAFTYYLGFRVNSGEYKLMGLAPYGDPGSAEVRCFEEIIEARLVDIKQDGSIWLNQEYFDYSTGLKMIRDHKWEDLFGMSTRDPDAELSGRHCNLALAIQNVTEKIVFLMAREAGRLTGSRNLCLAGGVALNCVSNGKLLKSGLFEDIWIQPAAGDAGGALGGAYCFYHIFNDKSRNVNGEDKMNGSLLGPSFSREEILSCAKKFKAVFRHYPDFDEMCERVAGLLSEGKVIGWFQGRMEWGPRALGGRSILADPRNTEMQKKLNLKIKFREGFRPFAPSVNFEELTEYFDTEKPSPYMMLISTVKEQRRNTLPAGYQSLPWRDKLYFLRSDVPAVTHIDFSARIQTVHKDLNPRFWRLIDRFKSKTGYGVVVNTSFNVRGEPIVCTPENAYMCFMNTEMDYLVIGDYLFDKKEQPDSSRQFKMEFGID